MEDIHNKIDDMRRAVTRLEMALVPDPGQIEPDAEEIMAALGQLNGAYRALTDAVVGV
jgi:hypothetical protein